MDLRLPEGRSKGEAINPRDTTDRMFRNYVEDGPALLTDPESKIRGHFQLENVSTTVANTLRRSILMETRSVGFRADLTNSADPGIRITKNTGPIFNEMLAHRLTLIPVGVRKLDEFDPSRYEIALSVSNTSNETIHVTASQFEVREKQDSGLYKALDPVVTAAMFPQDPITKSTSLITTLRSHWNPDLPPDTIELTAYPVIGRGREFMGFCPVACCAFENTRDDDPVRQESFFNDWLASFKKVTEPSSIDPALLETYRAEWKTMAIQRCFKINEKGQPSSFSFVVESVGIRPVRDVVAEGIRAVIELVKPYTDSTIPLQDLGLTVLPLESRMSGLRVIFEDQEHTLGCLLEAMVHELYLDTESPDAPLSYAAYKVPHPLQKKMVLFLGEASTPLDEMAVRKIVAAAAQRAITIFQDLEKAWSSF